MDPISHEFIAKLIGGTYVLTLGAYIFAWLGFNRVDDKLEKVRENHIVHLQQEVSALAKRVTEMDAITKRVLSLESTRELETDICTEDTSPL